MRKNDLIALLQAQEGNPFIYIQGNEIPFCIAFNGIERQHLSDVDNPEDTYPDCIILCHDLNEPIV